MNNENDRDSFLVNHYKVTETGSSNNRLNIFSNQNASSMPFYPQSNVQFHISNSNRSIWSSEPIRNILNENSSFNLPIKTNNDTWATKSDKSNIDNQSRSLSNNKAEHFKNDISNSSTPLWKYCLVGCLIGLFLTGITLAIITTLWLTNVKASTSTTTLSVAGTNPTATSTSTSTTVATVTICSNNPTTTGTTTAAPGVAQTLWYMSNPCSQQSSYTKISLSYIAQSTTEILTISMVNVPATTYLDDVSVVDVTTSTELLCNGGFESGVCSSCWSGTVCSYISTNSPHSGTYCISNPATSMTSLQQTFNTTIGRQLAISFWTMWSGSASTGIITSITIQP